jgi:methionyl-tRNA synthetase
LPSLAQKILDYYNPDGLKGPYQPLMTRVELPPLLQKKTPIKEKPMTQDLDQKPSSYISLQEFSKVQLRVGTVLEAQAVEGADKLLKLKISLGEKSIQVFSGIKKHVSPDSLLGTQVIVCVNLEPRQMKFGLSEGMVLAASDLDGLSLLTVHSPRQPGSVVS